jgi:hypothetical protein
MAKLVTKKGCIVCEQPSHTYDFPYKEAGVLGFLKLDLCSGCWGLTCKTMTFPYKMTSGANLLDALSSIRGLPEFPTTNDFYCLTNNFFTSPSLPMCVVCSVNKAEVCKLPYGRTTRKGTKEILGFGMIEVPLCWGCLREYGGGMLRGWDWWDAVEALTVAPKVNELDNFRKWMVPTRVSS